MSLAKPRLNNTSIAMICSSWTILSWDMPLLTKCWSIWGRFLPKQKSFSAPPIPSDPRGTRIGIRAACGHCRSTLPRRLRLIDPICCSSLVPRLRTLSMSVLTLARKAREFGKFIVVPACPTDAISLFFTLSANLGHPIAEASELFVTEAVGQEVLDRLHTLISAAHPNSVEWNPIQVYDFMTSTSDAIYCPYGFGYSNYSRAGRAVQLKFANAPAAGRQGCAGTMLGGTGIAISKKSRHPEKAIAYAKWLVSQEHQRGTYFREGGQPASLSAWTDPMIDAEAGGFFSGTLQTLQTAYLRPRFDGFVRFFEAAGIEINKCLKRQVSDSHLIAWLNARYATQRKRNTTDRLTCGGMSEKSQSRCR